MTAPTLLPPAAPAVHQTTGGNYFVANYPPFSFWRPEYVPAALAALDRAPAAGATLGLYVHIPFCRKRCHFCYFKVYTDKNAAEIRRYLSAMIRELEMVAARPCIGGRRPRFIYFGGGTPSYLSVEQLRSLVEAMKRLLPWDQAEEVTFECEPGTLQESKLAALRELGVTRLSLGVEHFDDDVLKANNRAHGSDEIRRAYDFARSVGFPQINIDLIAGMLGETDEKWRACVEKTLALGPDSVTIYQMEIPFNTTIFHEMRARGERVAPVADWRTKRAWVGQAFAELERAGYTVGSAYTAVRSPDKIRFVYRDALWSGADLVGIGVASFSHLGGTHYQNEKDMGPYLERVEAGDLPVHRALVMTDEERLIRQLVLQLKLGRVPLGPLREKFGVDVSARFAEPLARLRDAGNLSLEDETLILTREALLQVDDLLHEFFLPEHRAGREG
ncbi:MAG: coproporphyrinogen III oxidase family protein [Phycisphaerae bacterium]|jgi:oxygen-independent coproporphyrinogen-3 oxidase